MFDSYRHFLETPGYNKIIGDDYLIVEFKCPIQEELFTAWSECHSIVYVLSGQKKWITPEGDYLVAEDQSIFVRKGAFKNQQYFEEGFCVLMFFMKDSFIQRSFTQDIQSSGLSSKQIQHPKFIYRIELSESLRTLYHSFFSYLKEGTKMPPRIVELKFREMLLNICASNKNQKVRDLLFTLSQKRHGSIEQIMEEQFLYNLKLEDFARLCGKSLSTFKREFKKIYQTTPGKWLLVRRLQQASLQLIESTDPVQQIGYDCGFETDSHFIRSFKSKYGLTPKKWRMAKQTAVHD